MCKYLNGDGSKLYKCKLTHKNCTHQDYCNVTHKFKTDRCNKCPAYKEKK
jgi:hypothetical protein